MPGALTVLLAVTTPLPQSYAAFNVVDEACKLDDSTAHVSVAAGAIFMFGVVISCATLTDAVAVHPLAPVAVTV